MKKIMSAISVVILSLAILGGCSQQSKTTSTPSTPKTDTIESNPVTKDSAVFTKAISKNGTWIITITDNVTIDKDLVLEGNFKNEDVPPTPERIIELYNQDAKHVVTLTAPKLTIMSQNTIIKHGIFKGDIYVETNTFKLNDNKVIGNIYFKDAAARDGFKMDAESSVTGTQAISN